MQVELTTPERLAIRDVELWAQYQREDPALESPYFRPEFTQTVARVRSDVEVAILRDADGTFGYFPFQRRGRGPAKPVGGRLSDYHGVIARRGVNWEADALLRGCRLTVWDFDHVPAAQVPFHSFRRGTDLSPCLDVGRGFDAYRSELCRSGQLELRQTERKARKLGREVGGLRLDPNVRDPQSLETLIRWKRDQYVRTGATDVFSFRWTADLLHHLLTRRDAAFAGVLSVLYAGDQMVSAHMGMQSYGLLHWWFPAYDPRFAAYSPGRILLAELARHASAMEVTRIDLGRGVTDYKRRAMTGAIEVGEGSVDLRPVARRLRETWIQAQDWARKSPLRGTARLPGRIIHRLREWMEFR